MFRQLPSLERTVGLYRGGRQEHISIQLDAVKSGNLACGAWQRYRLGHILLLCQKRECGGKSPRFGLGSNASFQSADEKKSFWTPVVLDHIIQFTRLPMFLQELQIAHFDFAPLTTGDFIPKVQHRAGHMSRSNTLGKNKTQTNSKAAVWSSRLQSSESSSI